MTEKKEPHPKFTQLSKYKRPEGVFGQLGKGIDFYSDEELQALGEGLVKWIQKDGNIWCKYYFLTLEYPIDWGFVQKLIKRSPKFDYYIRMAISIQESKLVSEPYDLKKRKDGNHARWILARHHKNEWEDKGKDVKPEDEENLNTVKAQVKFMQDQVKSRSDLNIADSNINSADKSILDTPEDNA